MAAEIRLGASCVICLKPFVPRDSKQVTCGSRQCRDTRNYRLNRVKPGYVAMNRARSERRYALHNADAEPCPWLKGAPVYSTHLPGGACELTLTPASPIPLEKTHYLHGMLSAIDGRPHEPNRPAWSLLPWRSGWAVVWQDDGAAHHAKTSHQVTLYGRPATLSFGPLVKLRTPVVSRRGRHRIKLEAITPVSIKSAHKDRSVVYRMVPTSESLISTLECALAPRLGLKIARENICLNVISHRVESVDYECGKFGNFYGSKHPDERGVRGWVGHVIIECNAVARWLLECAARGWGLGARVSIGCGRIMVTDA